jgi:hypothetical protein
VVVAPADAVGIAATESDSMRAIQTARNWRRVCEWCGENTPADSLFLTPYGQQTFNWYSNRAEWFSWKHAPQDAAGLIEWNRRRELLGALQARGGAGISAWPPGMLEWLAEHQKIDFVIIPQRLIDQMGIPAGTRLVYPESISTKTTFCVLKVELSRADFE